MKWNAGFVTGMRHSANNSFLGGRIGGRPDAAGFSLLEVLTALAILALASSSVLVVVDRCVTSAANSSLRMEAFALVRENLEQVLVRDSVEESVEYGTSDKYPDVSWQTVIEAFPDPVAGDMWVRVVCSAEYPDSQGETQKVELTHWIAKLTEQQAGALMDDEDLATLEADQALATIEEAAEYAGVNTETIQQWIEEGLKTTEDDGFIKYNLDLFVEGQGSPTDESKAKQVESIQGLAMTLRTMQKEMAEAADAGTSTTGLTAEEIEKMDLGQILELIKKTEDGSK
ncbi:MAG: prepilin-type N-terminal cleavage/methylation domain-containing protein [Solirubrobacterales bacterium]